MPVRVAFEQLRRTCGCRSSSPRRRRDAETSSSRASAAVISGIGQSQIGRRIYRDPLDLTIDACLGRDRRRRAHPRRHRRHRRPTPAAMDVPPGFSGVGVDEVQDALRLKLNWFAGGLELPGQLGSVVNACARGRDRPGQPRAVLPHGVGGVARRATRAGPRSCPAAAAVDGGFRAERLHAVDAAVRRAVGGQLDRDDGAAPLPRVRHDARAAGADRAQRPAQRGAATRTRSTATR